MNSELNPDPMAAIAQHIEQLVRQHGSKPLERIIEGLQLAMGGGTPPPMPMRGSDIRYFPGLDDKPWYEYGEYAELDLVASTLEAAFSVARDEFLSVRAEDLSAYEVHMGRTAAQADEPRKSGGEGGVPSPPEWGTFSFRSRGSRDAAACARCPRTAELLDRLVANLGTGGAFFYSVLAPGGHIRPHYDPTNIRLTCHMGLIIPEGCSIRVASETRRWQEGRCLFFDPTFEHEAWNPSAVQRVCVIVNVWHPRLTPLEREVLTALNVYAQQAEDAMAK